MRPEATKSKGAGVAESSSFDKLGMSIKFGANHTSQNSVRRRKPSWRNSGHAAAFRLTKLPPGHPIPVDQQISPRFPRTFVLQAGGIGSLNQTRGVYVRSPTHQMSPEPGCTISTHQIKAPTLGQATNLLYCLTHHTPPMAYPHNFLIQVVLV